MSLISPSRTPLSRTNLPRSPLEQARAAASRVGSHDDVLRPRRRRPLRREIVAVIAPAWAEASDEQSHDVTAYARAPEAVTAEAARLLAAYLQRDEVVTATDDGRLVLRLRRADRSARPVRLQEMAYHAIEVFDRLGFHAGVVDLGVGWAPVTAKQGPDDARAQAGRAAAESVSQRDLQPGSRACTCATGSHTSAGGPAAARSSPPPSAAS